MWTSEGRAVSDQVLVVCDDLFFWARIEGMARSLGRTVVRVTGEEAMEQEWHRGAPRRILADLGSRSVDVIRWASRWKARETPPEIIGFVSHVDVETQERARGAGFDRVLSNSSFTRSLAELL